MRTTIFSVTLLAILLLATCQQPSPSVAVAEQVEEKPNYFVRENGDTILTGVPIRAEGYVVNLDTLPPPLVTLAQAPVKQKAYTNRLKVVQAKQIALPWQKVELATAPTLVNMKIDTVPAIFQAPQAVGLPRMKDDANQNIRYLTTKQGIHTGYCSALHEDSRGYIWYGTIADGAARYDGKSIQVFGKEEGLAGDRVWDITEDSAGNLWFATASGISKYDGTHFINFTKADDYFAPVVRVLEDRQGNFWFGTRKEILKFNSQDNTFIAYGKEQGMDCIESYALFEDQAGNIWTGGSRGLYQFRATGVFELPLNKDFQAITDFEENRDGSFWITTRVGLFKYEQEILTTYRFPEIRNDFLFHTIYKDKGGRIWFGSGWDGAIYYDDRHFYHWSTKEGMSDQEILAFMEDSSGKMWAATYSGGLNILDIGTFSYWTSEEGLMPYDVNYLLEDKDQNIWLASSGLSKYDGSFFYHYKAAQGFTDDVQFSLAQDEVGNIWFAGRALRKFDGENFTTYSRKQGMEPPYHIFAAKNGDIWISTHHHGAYRLRNSILTHFDDTNNLLDNTVWEFYEDQQENIWLMTDLGWSKFDGVHFTYYTTNEGLLDNYVYSMLEDENSDIWLSTGGGLQKMNGEIIELVLDYEAMGNDLVYDMVQDSLQNIWLIMGNGVALLEKDQLERRTSNGLHKFTEQAKLKVSTFIENAVIKDHNNQIWIGGASALTQLDINKFYDNYCSNTPSIHLNYFTLNDQFVNFSSTTDSLFPSIRYEANTPFQSYPINIRVPHNNNTFSFHFTGLDWSAPHQLVYQYKLEQLENDWNPTTKETKADYRNLPHGTYTFKVRAKGASNVWSEPFEYEFTIRPPWWQTPWAYLGYLLLGALAIWLYIRWRTRNLLKRQEKLEQTVTERTVEVVKEKERSEELLLNILPAEVAEELKLNGSSPARNFEEVTILFTDFKQFTAISEQMSPEELVAEINVCFRAFDEIITKYRIEKIKRMGDAYMAAGGLHLPRRSEPKDVVLAALEMQNFMLERQKIRQKEQCAYFEMRCGIHTGSVVAGIVGVKKFQYDIWGDTVNTAARMESSGEVGQVNISEATYELLKVSEQLNFTARGKVGVKGKGAVEMYFVDLL
ncbi:MAG: adenylate/guanylate cyclase domain-containing protein [Bacteroidota bacterium]